MVKQIASGVAAVRRLIPPISLAATSAALVKKDKVFRFFDYEDFRRSSGSQIIRGRSPTAQFRDRRTRYIKQQCWVRRRDCRFCLPTDLHNLSYAIGRFAWVGPPGERRKRRPIELHQWPLPSKPINDPIGRRRRSSTPAGNIFTVPARESQKRVTPAHSDYNITSTATKALCGGVGTHFIRVSLSGPPPPLWR